MDRTASLDKVRRQVDYYFSIENLLKDMYLRGKMDSDGWVELTILASFNRLRQMLVAPWGMGADLLLLGEGVATSPQLELDSTMTRVRRRDNWEQWVLEDAPQSKVEAQPSAHEETKYSEFPHTVVLRGDAQSSSPSGRPVATSPGGNHKSTPKGKAVRSPKVSPKNSQKRDAGEPA